MKEVEIITSVHQTHPGEEESGRGGKVRRKKRGSVKGHVRFVDMNLFQKLLDRSLLSESST